MPNTELLLLIFNQLRDRVQPGLVVCPSIPQGNLSFQLFLSLELRLTTEKRELVWGPIVLIRRLGEVLLPCHWQLGLFHEEAHARQIVETPVHLKA